MICYCSSLFTAY